MIDFIIVTSDLQPSVLGTWVKRDAELTTDSGGNARTRWWTPQMKRGFRLKESQQVGRGIPHTPSTALVEHGLPQLRL